MTQPEPGRNAIKKKCIACGELLLPGATKCKGCKSAQDEACKVCGEYMMPKAVFCNGCKSYQKTLPRISAKFATLLSLTLAVIAVGSGASSACFYLRDYHSDTKFKVASAEKNVLYLNVWNTGNKPSTLLNFRLSFGKLDIKPVDLELIREDRQGAKSVIVSGRPVKLGLWAPHDLVLLSQLDGKEYQKADIERILREEKPAVLRLDVDVEESDDPSSGYLCGLIKPRPFHTKSDVFTADRVPDFLLAKWRP